MGGAGTEGPAPAQQQVENGDDEVGEGGVQVGRRVGAAEDVGGHPEEKGAPQ